MLDKKPDGRCSYFYPSSWARNEGDGEVRVYDRKNYAAELVMSLRPEKRKKYPQILQVVAGSTVWCTKDRGLTAKALRRSAERVCPFRKHSAGSQPELIAFA